MSLCSMEMGTPSKEAVVVPHHAEHILAKLCEMRSEGKMCDIEIQCQDQTVSENKSIQKLLPLNTL